MEPVRIGFVGAGFMGQLAHLVNYDRLAEARVVALAEPRTELRARVARRYEIPETYEDHRALLADADVDAIVAPQPYHRHAALVPELLSAGRPLFTEKPIAVRPATGRQLADRADELDVAHMIGYHKRCDPAMERARTVIEGWRSTGAVGAMRFVRVTMPPGDWIAHAPSPIETDETPPTGAVEPPPEPFEGPAAELYDHVINYYVHQLNAIRYLTGEDYDVRYGTDRLLAVETDGGVEAVIELAPYETEHDWQESILVGFDRANVRIKLPPPLARQRSGTVTIERVADGEQTVRRPALGAEWAMFRQARRFVAVARGERQAPCGPREAAADLEAAAAYVRKATD